MHYLAESAIYGLGGSARIHPIHGFGDGFAPLPQELVPRLGVHLGLPPVILLPIAAELVEA